MWNALPDGVKLSASKGIFKNNIKNGRTINDISFNKGTVFNRNKRKTIYIISRIFLSWTF